MVWLRLTQAGHQCCVAASSVASSSEDGDRRGKRGAKEMQDAAKGRWNMVKSLTQGKAHDPRRVGLVPEPSIVVVDDDFRSGVSSNVMRVMAGLEEDRARMETVVREAGARSLRILAEAKAEQEAQVKKIAAKHLDEVRERQAVRADLQVKVS